MERIPRHVVGGQRRGEPATDDPSVESASDAADETAVSRVQRSSMTATGSNPVIRKRPRETIATIGSEDVVHTGAASRRYAIARAPWLAQASPLVEKCRETGRQTYMTVPQ
jgi:hypothetical protein